MNLVFAYLQMAYIIGTSTTADLRRILANRFRSEVARDYWARAGSAFLGGAFDRQTQEFYRIVQSEYERAMQKP
jgi:hypothetical protein